MKRLGVVAVAMAGMVTISAAGLAQTANPVVDSANEMYMRMSKYMVAAAEEMPADKYSFQPTKQQWTYAKIVSHVTQGNNLVCGMLAGGTAPSPTTAKFVDTATKPDLIAALKTSFDYCGATMNKLQDSQLGEPITFFGGAKKPKARALVEIVGDLEDHYSQMASYLRANGLVPPSAAPAK